MKKGKFITFEGGDGSGKTTQLQRIVAWLKEQDIDVLQTFEPGDTPLGKEIRRLLLSGEHTPVPAAELLLFLADRAQHVEEVIKPALAAGKWVICDRYTDSTLAYQLAGRQLKDTKTLRDMLVWAEQGLTPDKTIWLDLSVEDAAKRMASREAEGEAANRLDNEKIVFHKAVHQAFFEIQQSALQRVERIDARQNIAQVQADIQAVLKRL
ncbi:dTMP kinase [Ghiorsea bivora]|uniref:dTMP kinase n=1 Tax=Ghiorsea bivora TaxID=1485545 RepID=UPI000570B6FA|nr:dTMP kinase [Ghiorsea bivora]